MASSAPCNCQHTPLTAADNPFPPKNDDGGKPPADKADDGKKCVKPAAEPGTWEKADCTAEGAVPANKDQTGPADQDSPAMEEAAKEAAADQAPPKPAPPKPGPPAM